jgi:putative transposase
MRAHQGSQVLDRVVGVRGRPVDVRRDHGPECIARAVQRWLKQRHMQTVYIAPGSPWHNAYGERVGGRLRDACLHMEWFRTVQEAQVVIARWRRHDHEDRPHSSLA